MERYKEMLEVNDDAEWKALEPMVTKVSEARMQAMAGMGRGMFGGRGNRGGGGHRWPRRLRSTQSGGGFAAKAIDAKASNAETKAALENSSPTAKPSRRNSKSPSQSPQRF